MKKYGYGVSGVCDFCEELADVDYFDFGTISGYFCEYCLDEIEEYLENDTIN